MRGPSVRTHMVTLVLGALMLVVFAGAARAHDGLTSSDPADGASLAAPPAELVLTYSDDVTELGTDVAVTGPDGASVLSGPVTVTGAAVTVPLRTDVPAGSYAVLWRVTSSDGHPISGELRYTTQTGPAPTGAVESSAPEAGTSPQAAAAGRDDTARDTGASTAGAADWLPWAFGAGAVAAAVVALVLARRRLGRAGSG